MIEETRNPEMAEPLLVPLVWEDRTRNAPLDRPTFPHLRDCIDAIATRGLLVELDMEPGRAVMHLSGRLERQSAPMLKNGFQEIFPLISRSIDVDLAGVDRVDGMGLAALVWAWRLAQESGLELRLMRMRPYVQEIVAKMNLHHLLQIVGDREPRH